MRVVGENENGQLIEIAIGDAIDVRLPENASTGFRWTVAESGEPACAVASETREPGSPSKPGAPGAHHWHLHAKKAGDCEFKLAYCRPWEAASAPTREFAIRIRVTSK